MKNLRSVTLTGITILSIIASTHAYSQAMGCCRESGGYSRAGVATVTFGSGYDFFSSKRHIENTDIPFLAVGFDFTHHWGIEGYLGIFTTSFKKSFPVHRGITGTLFAVDGVYHFSPYRHVEPFVMAGVGITGLNPNGLDANNEGNLNAGVGVNLFISKAVAFRVEARDFYTMVGGKNDVALNSGVSFFLDVC